MSWVRKTSPSINMVTSTSKLTRKWGLSPRSLSFEVSICRQQELWATCMQLQLLPLTLAIYYLWPRKTAIYTSWGSLWPNTASTRDWQSLETMGKMLLYPYGHEDAHKGKASQGYFFSHVPKGEMWWNYQRKSLWHRYSSACMHQEIRYCLPHLYYGISIHQFGSRCPWGPSCCKFWCPHSLPSCSNWWGCSHGTWRKTCWVDGQSGSIPVSKRHYYKQ